MKFPLKKWKGLPAALPSLLLIVIISGTIYGNTFDNAFIFDDSLHLREGTFIRNFFRNFEWGYLLISRNIVNMSFAMNHAVGGLHVFGYHLVNLVIHILNGIVAFFLSFLMLKRLAGFCPDPAGRGDDGRNRLVALFAALIFIAHPVQTQAVTYIIQRYTSMAALFYLAAVLFYLKARSFGRCERGTPEREKGITRKEAAGAELADGAWSVPVFFGLFVLCAVLAFLSKQNAASLPLASSQSNTSLSTGVLRDGKRKIPWIALGFFLWGGFILYVSGFRSLPCRRWRGPSRCRTGGIFEGLFPDGPGNGRHRPLDLSGHPVQCSCRLHPAVPPCPSDSPSITCIPSAAAFFHGTALCLHPSSLYRRGGRLVQKELPSFPLGHPGFSSPFPWSRASFPYGTPFSSTGYLYLPLFGLSLALAGGVFRLFRRKRRPGPSGCWPFSS